MTTSQEVQARGAWAQVDLSAVRGNLDYCRAHIPAPTQLMAVVKADAYGHGLLEVARVALDWGCTWLGVGNLLEGLELRSAGIGAPCLVLTPPFPGEAGLYVRHNLTPSVDDAAILPELAAAVQAKEDGAVLVVHLLVDSGLGRSGVRPAGLLPLARAVAACPGLATGGAYTHFPQPANTRRTGMALAQFLAASAEVTNGLGRPPLLHAAGSEAALLVPESRLDLVRLGNLLYGYWGGPSPAPAAPDGRRPTAAWSMRARVIAVRDLLPGDGLGYGGFRARHPMRIAVLPVGLAEGLGLRTVQTSAGVLAVAETMLRETAKAALGRARPAALVRGHAAPLVGRVGMQFTMIDVSRYPDVEVGDEAILPAARATAARGLPRVFVG